MNSGNKEIFAKNLRSYINKNGKNRKDVAADLNVSYSTLTDWINGKKFPRIDKIEMLAEYFGVSKSDLIEDFEEIKKDLKLPKFDGGFTFVNINGKALYVEGQKGLLHLSEEKIMVRVNKKILIINGKNLKIKEMTKETISLTGEIEKTEVV